MRKAKKEPNWKIVEGTTDVYVSDTGLVKRNDEYIKLYTNPEGYLRASYGGGRREYVHRLVAKAFIPNPDKKPMVNHIDGNKQNNNVENLEWVSSRENSRKAYDIGLIPPVERNRRTPIVAIDASNGNVYIFDSQQEAYHALGISVAEISKALRANRNMSHGYFFDYINEDLLADLKRVNKMVLS